MNEVCFKSTAGDQCTCTSGLPILPDRPIFYLPKDVSWQWPWWIILIILVIIFIILLLLLLLLVWYFKDSQRRRHFVEYVQHLWEIICAFFRRICSRCCPSKIGTLNNGDDKLSKAKYEATSGEGSVTLETGTGDQTEGSSQPQINNTDSTDVEAIKEKDMDKGNSPHEGSPLKADVTVEHT